jgi:hypothetical protein
LTVEALVVVGVGTTAFLLLAFCEGVFVVSSFLRGLLVLVAVVVVFFVLAADRRLLLWLL